MVRQPLRAWCAPQRYRPEAPGLWGARRAWGWPAGASRLGAGGRAGTRVRTGGARRAHDVLALGDRAEGHGADDAQPEWRPHLTREAARRRDRVVGRAAREARRAVGQICRA